MLCKPFDSYIADCVEQIKRKRSGQANTVLDAAITANSPFELRPSQPTAGALLIHGLLDCPFSLRDIGHRLQQSGILSRAVLLPGHGTQPSDLLTVTYQDWIESVRYGIESLRQECDTIYLIGFSTGGTLSIYHALDGANIQGVVLLAPALKIQAPVSTIVKWPLLANFFSREDKWLCQEEETDYAKYESVPFNPVIQLGKLIEKINRKKSALTCPAMVVMSQDDETVSAPEVMRFFTAHTNDDSRFLLYTSKQNETLDKRFEIRNSLYPELNIKHLSHIALPFAPNNPHYGQQGDHPEHSTPNVAHTVYGAYNRVELKLYDKLNKLRLLKTRRLALSYNPDFDYMAQSIVDFITAS
jgi:esterase/lipase